MKKSLIQKSDMRTPKLPGPLPSYDGANVWYNLLPPPGPPAVLAGTRRCKFAVLGGGFVGLAAARRLGENEPSAEIILVEALRIGQGASGANSGFIIDVPHKRDLAHPSLERKQRIHRLNRAAIQWLEELVQRHGIDCQWTRAGKFQAAVGTRGLRFLEAYREMLGNFGSTHEVLDAAETSARLGTSYYRGSVYTPDGILMQPAALCRGLAESLPENVTILENSPVLRVEPVGRGWRLQGVQGTVEAECLLLGSNVFSRDLGFLKGRMVPVMTFASLTRPLEPDERSLYQGLPSWGLTPADHAGASLRLTPDGRFLFRSEYRYAPAYVTSAADRARVGMIHRDGFIRRYPMLARVPFENTWCGVCGLSRNYEAFFGEVRPGVFFSGVHQSVGAARGTISGLLLADMACGRPNPLVEDMQFVSPGPNLLPPEPLLGLGARARMSIQRWQSRSEA
jgi:glycine/D-amino acid oxidase-like deaminating enzyme